MNTEKHTASPEMDEFNEALRGVMHYSKEDLKKLLAKEKAANADRPKRGAKPKHTIGYLQKH